MSDFITGSWALISGLLYGPIGLFFGAFLLTALAVVLILTIGSGTPKLNPHIPMPPSDPGKGHLDSREENGS